LKLAIDIDGVLAGFTDACSALITEVSGVTFPKESKEWPTVWSWEKVEGVTHDHMSLVWGEIMREGSNFWEKLKPTEECRRCLKQLNWLSKRDNEVYFLTNRMGHRAKYQTERFLYEHGMDFPTVILSGDKIPLILDLGIDFFIDDKPDTVYDLYQHAERVELSTEGRQWFLLDAPYNRRADLRYPGTKIAMSLEEALRKAGLWQLESSVTSVGGAKSIPVSLHQTHSASD